MTLLVPEKWPAFKEMTDAFPELSRGTLGEFGRDIVGGFEGVVAGAGLVIADRRVGESEIKSLAGRDTTGLSAGSVAGFIAAGILKETLAGIPGGEPVGEVWSLRTGSGRPASAFSAAVPGSDGGVVMTRYCAHEAGHLYTLTFIARKRDFESLKDSFERIAKSWAW